MADLDDVRRLVVALPGVTEGEDGRGWRVGGRLLAWCWPERVDPRKPRLVNPRVLVVRVRDEAEKAERIASDPAIFFTEPHYDGYAAVLVRLEAIDEPKLDASLRQAWRLRAPKELLGRLPDA
jgi:hypothetical protein